MSAPQALSIPYEQQADPHTNRMCGAAALSMVYRSLGRTVAQADIWQKIGKRNRFGSLASTTHLITQDALDRGFAALAIQAKYPLQLLRRCQDQGFRVILNHRLREDQPTGHFTVLVRIDDEQVIVHDPYSGPSRRLGHAELLELWRPRYLNAEIAGNVLIGIAAQPAPLPACTLCGTAIPARVDCPQCRKALVLQPAALLGCVAGSCPGRMWNYLVCSACDHTWSFTAGAVTTPEEPQQLLPSLNKVCESLDQFCESILSNPASAQHPQLALLVELIRANKDKLKLAHSEESTRRQMHLAQMSQLEQVFKQKEEAILKQREAIKQPAPPLDGKALGEALLTDLGLLGREAPANTPPSSTPPKKRDDELLEMLRKTGLWAG